MKLKDYIDYIENICKYGEYTGIIEISIATEIFSINIFLNSIMDKYILYKEIGTDNNYDKCNLLFENGNNFSIWLNKKNLNSKRIISTPTNKKSANYELLKINNDLIDKKKKFDNNNFIIIKKDYNYYDGIYNFLKSKKISKK